MSRNAAALTPQQFALTAASVFAAVLPHLPRMPRMFALLVVVLLVWRVIQRMRGGARIPAWIKVPLVVAVHSSATSLPRRCSNSLTNRVSWRALAFHAIERRGSLGW